MGSLRSIEIYNDSLFTLIAVESVDFRQRRTNTDCQLYGSIKPIAVVVCGPDRTYALDMEARSADLDQLKLDVPELDSMLRHGHSLD